MKEKKNKGNVRKIVTLKEARKSNQKRSTVAPGIQFDKATNHFLVEFYYGMVDGKPKRVRKTFLTLEEAKEALARFKVEKLDGLPENISKRITLGECIDEYIEENDVQETTKRGYRVISNRIKKSPLHRKLLKDVNENDIENYMRSLKGDCKNTTINKDYELIHGTLKYAVKRKYLSINRADYVEKFSEKECQFSPRVVDYSEYPDFLEKVNATGDNALIITAHLGMLQGLRRGEMIGLTWEKVDFEQGTITIDQTITTVGCKMVIKPPKTEQSKRVLMMNERVKKVLSDIMDQERESGQLSEYVLHNKSGDFFNPTDLSKKFKGFVDKNGYKGVRLHDLRHSYATASMKMGATIYAVSGALGHSNIGTTANYYVHTKSRDGSKAVNDILKF